MVKADKVFWVFISNFQLLSNLNCSREGFLSVFIGLLYFEFISSSFSISQRYFINGNIINLLAVKKLLKRSWSLGNFFYLDFIFSILCSYIYEIFWKFLWNNVVVLGLGGFFRPEFNGGDCKDWIQPIMVNNSIHIDIIFRREGENQWRKNQ